MALSVDIKKRLGRFQLAVRFDMEDEIIALFGSSGCGKSVTLRCIAGIMTPDEGRIVLDGRTLFDSERKIDLVPQERRVGYLFQHYALFPNMTVEQNITAVIRGREQKRERTRTLLRRFQLENVRSQLPSQLSGGQQQRAALARILASEPQTLLLDEPFSALDSYLRAQLEQELWDTLAGFGGAVVWVSHDRDEVFRNCKRVCVIDSGSSMPVVSPHELFVNPRTISAARLSGCKNIIAVTPGESSVLVEDWGVT
ncbi:MAG: sulfate/molybdate ABC transporter ATP-binding protein, partial [Spirochaetota bacterium]